MTPRRIARIAPAIAAALALFLAATRAFGTGTSLNTVVETFYTPKDAFARMVPGAPRLSFARFTLTPAEASRIKSRWGIELSPAEEHTFFFGWSAEDSLVGAMYVGQHPGKHGPIHLAVGLTPRGVVRDLAVMRYQEVYGKPVREESFLRQYVGKGIRDPIRLGRDVQNLTGATFSSRAVTAVVKESVVLFEVYVKERKAAVPPAAGTTSGSPGGG